MRKTSVSFNEFNHFLSHANSCGDIIYTANESADTCGYADVRPTTLIINTVSVLNDQFSF